MFSAFLIESSMLYKKKFALDMVFCHYNCSDLLWEKNVLVIKKNFWNSRLKASNMYQKFFLYQTFFSQYVRTILDTKYNLLYMKLERSSNDFCFQEWVLIQCLDLRLKTSSGPIFIELHWGMRQKSGEKFTLSVLDRQTQLTYFYT
jgi:hypothetical protein